MFGRGVVHGGAGARAGASAPRPVVAPADNDALERAKTWASAALAPLTPHIPDIQVYIRQIACRKPDCVPVETIVLLLGNGWNVKEEILKPVDELVEQDIAEAMPKLHAQALSKVHQLIHA